MKNSDSKGIIRLFVYGTLRKGGLAEHFLQQFSLVSEGTRLKGYALYDAGWYPFAVPAIGSDSIVGDVFEVPEKRLTELDEYEGPDYKLVFLEEQQFFLYLKLNQDIKDFVQVESGDWLTYWKEKMIRNISGSKK